MSDTATAIVVGVGPEAGLGGALCKRLASEGLHVFVSGRTAEKVEKVAASIRAAGHRATAVTGDTTLGKGVIAVFDRAEREGPLDLVIYNAGNAALGELHDMDAAYFEAVWRVGCFGGFLVGREAVRRMLPHGRGSVIVTGATPSLRGNATTSAVVGTGDARPALARRVDGARLRAARHSRRTRRGRRRHRGRQDHPGPPAVRTGDGRGRAGELEPPRRRALGAVD